MNNLEPLTAPGGNVVDITQSLTSPVGALKNYLAAKAAAALAAAGLNEARAALVDALDGPPPAGTQKTREVGQHRVVVKSPLARRVVGEENAVVAIAQAFAHDPDACPVRRKTEWVVAAAACEALREKDAVWFNLNVAPLLEVRSGAVQVEVKS